MGDYGLYTVSVQTVRLLVKLSPAKDLELGTEVAIRLLDEPYYALPGHDDLEVEFVPDPVAGELERERQRPG